MFSYHWRVFTCLSGYFTPFHTIIVIGKKQITNLNKLFWLHWEEETSESFEVFYYYRSLEVSDTANDVETHF